MTALRLASFPGLLRKGRGNCRETRARPWSTGTFRASNLHVLGVNRMISTRRPGALDGPASARVAAPGCRSRRRPPYRAEQPIESIEWRWTR